MGLARPRRAGSLFFDPQQFLIWPITIDDRRRPFFWTASWFFDSSIEVHDSRRLDATFQRLIEQPRLGAAKGIRSTCKDFNLYFHTTEMNPLFVPELLHSVLDNLSILPSEGPMTLEERRTLVALARTCSTLSEPSLDRLWRSLDSLLSLIRSFADVVDTDRVRVPPSTQEWFIINRYAPRILKLSLGPDCLSWHFLGCTKLTLPNLKVLKWELGPESDISYIWSLLTPKIVTLDLEFGSITDTGSQSFLENFTRLCPNSKSINFKFLSLGGLALVSATKVLSQAICSRTDWERVKLSCAVDDAMLRHLGLLSTLKEVSLTLASEAGPEDMRFDLTETPFRNVTRLALTVWKRMDVATNLLRVHDQAFHAFEMRLHNIQTTIMDVSALMTAIVSPQRAHSLRSLEVTVFRLQNFMLSGNMLGGDIPELPYEVLRPITSLVHLRELVFDLNHSITIDDDEFASLVCNWPCLESIWLTGRCEESAKSISLKGLLSLLVSCRKLQKISLSLDVQRVPSEADCALVAGSELCWPSVTHLAFQGSPIDDPEFVAKFLRRYLPGVDGVSVQFQTLALLDRIGLHKLWSCVNDQMQIKDSV